MQSLVLRTTIKWECWNTTDRGWPVVQIVASRTPSCVAQCARSLVRLCLCFRTGTRPTNALYRLLQRILSIGGLEGGPIYLHDFDCPLYGFSITKRIVERRSPFPKNTYAYFEVQNAYVLMPKHWPTPEFKEFIKSFVNALDVTVIEIDPWHVPLKSEQGQQPEGWEIMSPSLQESYLSISPQMVWSFFYAQSGCAVPLWTSTIWRPNRANPSNWGHDLKDSSCPFQGHESRHTISMTRY